MSVPVLTPRRWQCLVALKRQPVLMRRAFMARELMIESRGRRFPASGATLDSLRAAGWVEKVTVDWGAGRAFRMGAPPTSWRVTEAGRKAAEECPDIFPKVLRDGWPS